MNRHNLCAAEIKSFTDKTIFQQRDEMDFTDTELLEAWDWAGGVPSGTAVARGESYKNGIAHEGVHLWIIRAGINSYEVLFQHRSPDKALYPDCLDITVGGHVPFGLKDNKVQKEAMEELGISPSDADMADLGYIRFEEIAEDYIHREFQHVYIMRDDRPLESYRFNDGEVTGICSVPADFLVTLFKKDNELSVPYYNGTSLVKKKVSKKDFHPLLFSGLMKEYMAVLFAAFGELMQDGAVKTVMPGISPRAGLIR